MLRRLLVINHTHIEGCIHWTAASLLQYFSRKTCVFFWLPTVQSNHALNVLKMRCTLFQLKCLSLESTCLLSIKKGNYRLCFLLQIVRQNTTIYLKSKLFILGQVGHIYIYIHTGFVIVKVISWRAPPGPDWLSDCAPPEPC